jgi:hypothetical protein
MTDKKEFTVDEISCAYCVYYNPVLEDYMHELQYDQDKIPDEGIASFGLGEKTLKELKSLLTEEKILELFKESMDGDYTKCTIEDYNYEFEWEY